MGHTENYRLRADLREGYKDLKNNVCVCVYEDPDMGKIVVCWEKQRRCIN